MPQHLRSRLESLLPAAAVAAILIGVNACTHDAPTSSSDSAGSGRVVSASVASDDSQYDTDGDGQLSRAERLARRAARRAAKDAERQAFNELVNDWKAYQDAIKQGNVRADLLRCEPVQRTVVSRVIGPRGGRIEVARHQLIIPEGALANDTLITATAVPGNVVQVEFEPHGLQFARPVMLKMNYASCIVPLGFDGSVVYLDNGFHLIETRPSFDDGVHSVSAWLDHFSGYAIATRTATR